MSSKQIQVVEAKTKQKISGRNDNAKIVKRSENSSVLTYLSVRYKKGVEFYFCIVDVEKSRFPFC